MRKLLPVTALILLLSCTAFASRQDFELQNYSGRTVVRIFASPSYLDNYTLENEFTGDGLPLKSGESTTLRFDSGDNKNTQYWDMLVFFDNDDDCIQYRRLDLLKISSIVIDGNGEIFTK